jgi:uncharacterized protein (DUF488 family)
VRRTLALSTIGFTRTTAERFFGQLAAAGVRTVLDVRLRTGGQLSGFAKVPDLPFLLRAVAGIGYRHVAELAPTAEMLDRYRADRSGWDRYAAAYRELLEQRRPERALDPELLDHACLLCSEPTAERCHRRLAAEYLREALQPALDLDVVHL